MTYRYLFGEVLAAVTEYKANLKEAQKMVAEASLNKIRKIRQVAFGLGALAGGAIANVVGNIINTFTSGYTDDQIQLLREEFRHNSGTLQLITKNMENITTALTLEDKELKRLFRSMKQLSQQSEEKFKSNKLNLIRMYLFQLAQKLRIDFTTYFTGIKNLLEGRLSNF